LAAYDEHADAIFRFCYAQAGDREAAADATQEAFVRVWKYLAGGKTIEQMKPFLYRTARNVLIDRHRRPRAQSLQTLQDTGFDPADDRAPDPSLSAEVARALRLAGQLEPKYREAVLLRYGQDLSPGEIADVIGESENTVSVRIHRGIQKLRGLMGLKK